MILDRTVAMIGPVLVGLACVFVAVIARFRAGVGRSCGGRLMMHGTVAGFSERRLESERGHGEEEQGPDQGCHWGLILVG